MGEPARGHARAAAGEHIAGWRATRGTETSKYPEEEKSNEIPLVAASERGHSPNPCMRYERWGAAVCGVVGAYVRDPRSPGAVKNPGLSQTGMERPAAEGKSPVGEGAWTASYATRVGPGT